MKKQTPSPVSNESWAARSFGETKVPNTDNDLDRSLWTCDSRDKFYWITSFSLKQHSTQFYKMPNSINNNQGNEPCIEKHKKKWGWCKLANLVHSKVIKIKHTTPTFVRDLHDHQLQAKLHFVLRFHLEFLQSNRKEQDKNRIQSEEIRNETEISCNLGYNTLHKVTNLEHWGHSVPDLYHSISWRKWY